MKMPAQIRWMRGLRWITYVVISMLGQALVLPVAKGQIQAGLNRDSLLRELALMPANTGKVATLISMGQQYENSLPDSAIHYYEQARKLSGQLHYPAGFVQYVNNYTAVLNVQGKYEQSLKLLLQARDTCKRYDLHDQLWKVLINTGALYQQKDDYEKAAVYYLESLPVLEKQGNSRQISAVYGNLCSLYRTLDRGEQALDYGRRSLAAAEKSKDPYSIAMACSNLGNILKDLGQTAKAMGYLERTYRIAKQLGDINQEETALINMANTHDRASQPHIYLPMYRQALGLARSLGDIVGETIAIKGIAEGQYWSRQYKAAEATLDTAITFAFKNGQRDIGRMLLLLMSDVQIALGKNSQSVAYRTQFDSVQNELVNDGLLKNIQELETKYNIQKQKQELLQKDLLLAQHEQESLRQRIGLLLACAGVLVLGLLLYLSYRYYRHRQQLQQQELAALQAAQENVRLKALLEGQEQERQRISQEMHDDMGSGLTSLLFQSRMVKEPVAIAEKIQRSANGLLRKMNEIIWTMNTGQDTLDSLLAYTRLNLIELLENAGIHYQFDLPENMPDIPISQEYRRNFYLVTTEAVHNVLKHAAATEVVITVKIGSFLAITIRDNGKGFDPAQVRRFGNGLSNLKRRMEQIGGQFTIQSSNGTVVEFTAPLANG